MKTSLSDKEIVKIYQSLPQGKKRVISRHLLLLKEEDEYLDGLEATNELLSIPGFLSDFKAEKEYLKKGKKVHLQDITVIE